VERAERGRACACVCKTIQAPRNPLTLQRTFTPPQTSQTGAGRHLPDAGDCPQRGRQGHPLQPVCLPDAAEVWLVWGGEGDGIICGVYSSASGSTLLRALSSASSTPTAWCQACPCFSTQNPKPHANIHPPPHTQNTHTGAKPATALTRPSSA